MANLLRPSNAGTGIATALLHARGAEVVAIEPGARMAAVCRRGIPGVPVVRGDSNAVPLTDGSQDLVTYAKSWQWTDPAGRGAGGRRVLRRDGAVAIWCNTTAFEIPW